jgi:hypothetical protein
LQLKKARQISKVLAADGSYNSSNRKTTNVARSQTRSTWPGHQSRSVAGFNVEQQRQRMPAHARSSRHAKGIRQGLACWPVLEAAQEWYIQANCGASSMNYTQTQLAHRSIRQTTELYRISSGSCPHVTTLFNVFRLMIQTTFRRNATMTASPYRPHSIAS